MHPGCKTIRAVVPAAAFALAAVIASGLAQAGDGYRVLYSFNGGPLDGSTPVSDVTLDSVGNVYGTTEYGGGANKGSVFRIVPSGAEMLLHGFDGEDGSYPLSGVIYDQARAAILGAASYGGDSGNCFDGCGVIYQLASDGTETVLHSFNGIDDGIAPVGSLLMGKLGNLRGVASQGGSAGYGTVFRLKANRKFVVLHAFAYGDGAYPASGPVADAAGNLYGTTEGGGAYDGGAVYKIATDGTATVLHAFTGAADGSDPKGGLAFDSKGNLFGAAYLGGGGGYGAIYKISPRGKFTTLYSFTGGADGANPESDLIEAGGKLYGTASRGGAFNDGAIFEVAKSGTVTVLHSFAGGQDGIYPYSGVTLGPKRSLYGATSMGGTGGFGVVYRLKLKKS